MPIAEARSQPDSAYVRNKLYYGTVYRVIDAVTDDAREWWYRLQDGVAYAPGPYVPAWSVRRTAGCGRRSTMSATRSR